MLKRFFIACLLLTLLLPLNLAAQEAAAPAPVNEAEIKQLITTLESETARTEFISNLKLLLSEQTKAAEAEQAIAPITQALGVESFTGQLVTQYQDFLARNDLKGSTVGKIALTIVISLVFLALAFGIRRGITKGLVTIDKLFKKLELPPIRLRFYGRALRGVATVFLIGLLAYTFFAIWVPAESNPLEAPWFGTAVKTAFNLVFVIFIALAVWEVISIGLQIVLRRAAGDNATRTQTILPIVRNVLFIVYAILFALMILSEVGINIVPLLAGAGIVGVAIGFGAQTMVKDFITGFTILMEDVVRVGDVAKVAGHEGAIEKITLRKIQLRDFGGRVYTIPFGEITTIENATKDFSFYAMDIGVSYKSDTDHVCDILRRIDAELRADPTLAPEILEPIEIMGVDRFADSAVIIKARIKTLPQKQWMVGREFNRRMKKAFEAEGIEIPFPQRVVTLKNEEK